MPGGSGPGCWGPPDSRRASSRAPPNRAAAAIHAFPALVPRRAARRTLRLQASCPGTSVKSLSSMVDYENFSRHRGKPCHGASARIHVSRARTLLPRWAGASHAIMSIQLRRTAGCAVRRPKPEAPATLPPRQPSSRIMVRATVIMAAPPRRFAIAQKGRSCRRSAADLAAGEASNREDGNRNQQVGGNLTAARMQECGDERDQDEVKWDPNDTDPEVEDIPPSV